jgi:hypothetical protein
VAAVVAIFIAVSAKRANWAMVREQATANRQHQDELNRLQGEREAAERDRSERANRRARLITPDVPAGGHHGFSFWNGSSQRITGFRVLTFLDQHTGREGLVQPEGRSGPDAAGVIDADANAHFIVTWWTSADLVRRVVSNFLVGCGILPHACGAVGPSGRGS